MKDLVSSAVGSRVNLTIVPDTEALDGLYERGVDALILTDGLATTDAVDLIAEIRREFPSLPTVFSPNSDSGVLASDALAAGVDDYVPLSVVSDDPNRLRVGIDRAVQARSLPNPSDELAALHTATREMIAADSSEALADRVIEASGDVLGFDYASVHYLNEEGTALVAARWTEQLEEIAGEPPSLGPDSLAWPAFANESTKYYTDVQTVDETPVSETAFRTELFVPLGEYGLLGVSSPDQDAFNAHQREIANILGANATAALDSITRTAELRETTRELQDRNDQLDQFVSVVSHDLRNPLNVAEGYVGLAREECDSEHLETVADAHDRMHTLIENLLVVARSDEQIGELEPVDLASLLRVCWTHVATSDATLSAAVDKEIRADPSRLQQLLENLMRNAVEHGGDEVEVTVGTFDGGFFVEDDGFGIPADEREKVFEVGYSAMEDGTGFGLSIVEQVASGHGWDVHVTEGSEGGARFEITGVEPVSE